MEFNEIRIKEIQSSTNTILDIEETDKNTGIVTIFSDNKEQLDEALNQIKLITAVPQVGDEYDAKVVSIMPYGAFVEFLPGKQGLLHISEISWSRVEKVEDVLKESDQVKVKLIGLDQRNGKFKLSRKVLFEKPVEK